MLKDLIGPSMTDQVNRDSSGQFVSPNVHIFLLCRWQTSVDTIRNKDVPVKTKIFTEWTFITARIWSMNAPPPPLSLCLCVSQSSCNGWLCHLHQHSLRADVNRSAQKLQPDPNLFSITIYIKHSSLWQPIRSQPVSQQTSKPVSKSVSQHLAGQPANQRAALSLLWLDHCSSSSYIWCRSLMVCQQMFRVNLEEVRSQLLKWDMRPRHLTAASLNLNERNLRVRVS